MALILKLTKEDKQRIKDNFEELFINPDSFGQCINQKQCFKCPKITWEGLGHNSGMGEWSCILKEKKEKDLIYGSEHSYNLPCDCSDYKSCQTLKGFIKNNQNKN